MVIPKSASILTTKTYPIENDYVILKPIGEGMNGKVHLCQNKFDKKKYALKVNNTIFYSKVYSYFSNDESWLIITLN